MKSLLLLLAAVIVARWAATALTVAPATISNSFNGEITLSIDAPALPGQRVVADKFHDWENVVPISGGNLCATQTGTDALTGTNVNESGELDIRAWRIGMSFPIPGSMIAQNAIYFITTGTGVNGFVLRLRGIRGSISPTVKNIPRPGVANLSISATASLRGATFSTFGSSCLSGNYSLSVFVAPWTVGAKFGGLGNIG